MTVDWYISSCKCWHCFKPRLFRIGRIGFGFQIAYLNVAVELVRGPNTEADLVGALAENMGREIDQEIVNGLG